MMLRTLLVAVPSLVLGFSNCDGINCWLSLPANEQDIAHWTPERLAAAVPAPLAKLSLPPSYMPTAGNNSNDSSNPAPTPAPCTAPAKVDNATSCLKNGLPCASMGKIYFVSSATGQPASCSGTFIAENVVLTAGHCCMEEPGKWCSNLTFFLDYNEGQSSGTFLPTEVHVPQPWADSSTRTYDWCFMKMKSDGPKHLPTASAYDPSKLAEFSSFGWPALPPYDGNNLWYATGQCAGTSPQFPPSGYDPCRTPNSTAMIYMTCNSMTPGCSGGPWYDPAIGVFGHNSALILAPGQPEIYVSPYFGNDFYESCKQVGACT